MARRKHRKVRIVVLDGFCRDGDGEVVARGISVWWVRARKTGNVKWMMVLGAGTVIGWN